MKVGTVEDDQHKSRCCPACTIRHFSLEKATNWAFLIGTTCMCMLGSMTIGAALYNDGPIAVIIGFN